VAVLPDVPVLAVAGIARPDAFFAALGDVGYAVVGTVAFRDHHAFSSDDLSDLAARAMQTGARYVVTTEKDLVRLLPHAPFAFQLLSVPLAVAVEPGAQLRAWLGGRIKRAREAR
jgi:tetraacyldisaccharide 4'-kinase